MSTKEYITKKNGQRITVQQAILEQLVSISERLRNMHTTLISLGKSSSTPVASTSKPRPTMEQLVDPSIMSIPLTSSKYTELELAKRKIDRGQRKLLKITR